MANRDKPTTTPVKCNKCGIKAMGIPNHRHRRCGGGEGQVPKAKRAERLPYEERGMWKPA